MSKSNKAKVYAVDPSLIDNFKAVYVDLKNVHEAGVISVKEFYKPSPSNMWISPTPHEGADPSNFLVWDGLDVEKLVNFVGHRGRNLKWYYNFWIKGSERILQASTKFAELNRVTESLRKELSNYKNSVSDYSKVAKQLTDLAQSNSHQAQKYGVIPEIYNYSFGSSYEAKEQIEVHFNLAEGANNGLLSLVWDSPEDGRDKPTDARDPQDKYLLDMSGGILADLAIQDKKAAEKLISEDHVSDIFVKSLSPSETRKEIELWSSPMRVSLDGTSYYDLSVPYYSKNPLGIVDLDWLKFLENITSLAMLDEDFFIRIYMGDLSNDANKVFLASFANTVICSIAVGLKQTDYVQLNRFLKRLDSLPTVVDDDVPAREHLEDYLRFVVFNNRDLKMSTSAMKRFNKIETKIPEASGLEDYGVSS